MIEITMPRFNTNDDKYVIIQWLVPEGKMIDDGTSIALIEGSKAVQELAMAQRGFVVQLRQEGEECAIGEVIAQVCETEAQYLELAARRKDVPVNKPDNEPNTTLGAPPSSGVPQQTVTVIAQERMEKFGVTMHEVTSLNKRLVRGADIDALVAARTECMENMGSSQDQQAMYLSRNQKAIAKVVMRSHSTIPAAFVSCTVRVSEAIEVAKALSQLTRTIIGISEIVAYAVAKSREDFPLFFASVFDIDDIKMSSAANVGITVDVGQGLTVPVIHAAESLSLQELARQMLIYRMKAIRSSFKEADLAGGNVLLSINVEEFMEIAIPIILPTNVCALSICGPRLNLRIEHDGESRAEQVMPLGLAYDHRIVNGREANQFMAKLRELLEFPHWLTNI